jgi:predicted ATPase
MATSLRAGAEQTQDRTPGGGAPVTREDVRARLDEALRQAGRTGGALTLAGEAGSGKSRLLEAAAARARSLGRTVLAGAARASDAGIPLAVVRDALRARRRARSEDAAPADPLAASFPAMLLPELGADGSAPRDLVFEAAVRHLDALAGAAGLVVVLEDLHHADAASCALVAHLARCFASARSCCS